MPDADAEAADEAKTRISHLQKAVLETPGADPSLHQELRTLEEGLLDLEIDATHASSRDDVRYGRRLWCPQGQS